MIREEILKMFNDDLKLIDSLFTTTIDETTSIISNIIDRTSKNIESSDARITELQTKSTELLTRMQQTNRLKSKFLDMMSQDCVIS